MEAENRLEGRRDPIATVFCCSRRQSSQMSSVFSISEGRFTCTNYQLNSATSKEASRVADRPRSCVHPRCTLWTLLSSGRVCKR